MQGLRKRKSPPGDYTNTHSVCAICSNVSVARSRSFARIPGCCDDRGHHFLEDSVLSERHPERATSAAPAPGTNTPPSTGVNVSEVLYLTTVGLVGVDALGIVTATVLQAIAILQRNQPAILGAAFPDLFEASERQRLSDF